MRLLLSLLAALVGVALGAGVNPCGALVPCRALVPQVSPAPGNKNCVSISAGTTDYWCQSTCVGGTSSCPETVCKCSDQDSAIISTNEDDAKIGADAAAPGTQAEAEPAAASPTEPDGHWGVATNTSCVSVSPGSTDYWCQIQCAQPTGCPEEMCKCGDPETMEKKAKEAALMDASCDFDAEGCIKNGAAEDCRTCALHITACAASPHLDDDGTPAQLTTDDCLDDVASKAKGCKDCSSKESKDAWRIRVGDQAPQKQKNALKQTPQ